MRLFKRRKKKYPADKYIRDVLGYKFYEQKPYDYSNYRPYWKR